MYESGHTTPIMINRATQQNTTGPANATKGNDREKVGVFYA